MDVAKSLKSGAVIIMVVVASIVSGKSIFRKRVQNK